MLGCFFGLVSEARSREMRSTSRDQMIAIAIVCVD